MNPDRRTEPRTARVVAFYEGLDGLAALAALPEVYAEEARFRDPFNDLRGHAAIHRVFAHMFEALQTPRFTVQEAVVQGDVAYLAWTFRFGLPLGRRVRPIAFEGATRLHFDAAGRVDDHRDHWDAAAGLYAQLPLLGGPARWLQRRLATPGAAALSRR